MLDQRRRRWPDVVEILYKCFVFAGLVSDTTVNLTCQNTVCNSGDRLFQSDKVLPENIMKLSKPVLFSWAYIPANVHKSGPVSC